MGWYIEPGPPFRLRGGTGPTTLAEFAEQRWPPCPVCATSVQVDVISVPDLGVPPSDWRYIMGQWHCPRGCDPKRRPAGSVVMFGEPFRFSG